MSGFLFEYLDLIVVAALAVVCIVVVFLVRVQKLPKQSLWFVVGALLGVGTFAVVRNLQKKALLKDLEILNARIKARDEELAQQRDTIVAHDKLVAELKTEYAQAQAAYHRQILALDAKSAEDKKKHAAMSDQEAFDEFSKIFGNN
ncbi:MAG: hypothetical protein OEW08_09515 [Gammaproteobacteria bacterium]|nr:hypothetical protein [Gammaproteobacteria bacterium]